MLFLRVGPLVRATTATRAVIWAETSQACTATLMATPYDTTGSETLTVSAPAIAVGGRYYVALQLDALQPATWYSYTYQLRPLGPGDAETVPPSSMLTQCFRTLDAPAKGNGELRQAPETTNTLRLAYGSCRRLDRPDQDVLAAFGAWLMQRFDERETLWPQLLLLIGDQIYADMPPRQLRKTHAHLRQGARSFEDFAQLYEHAWTYTEGIRQVLAVLPTYMIYDDHEVTNNWNIGPTWRARAIQKGLEQMLVDGLVAYWVYQGWGNLYQSTSVGHPLMQIMQDAALSGKDALEDLRACIRDTLYDKSTIDWHYVIPTTPSIFVANARTERSVVSSTHSHEIYAPGRIMSRRQMAELQAWAQAHDREVSILVSSVPILLPPLIGLAEYVAGQRLWSQRGTLLSWLGRQLARLQLRVALCTSFDHWPVYAATWRELLQLLTERRADLLVLSGDVHFSYTLEGRQTSAQSSHPRLYQLVSTPFENVLEARSRQKIELQAHVSQLSYAGLHTRMLPLHTTEHKADIQHDLLFENTLAYIRLERPGENAYTVQQDYLSLVDGRMEVVARTTLPPNAR
jgi:phosphodiesterase/alkaline phosphatase D-like protein